MKTIKTLAILVATIIVTVFGGCQTAIDEDGQPYWCGGISTPIGGSCPNDTTGDTTGDATGDTTTQDWSWWEQNIPGGWIELNPTEVKEVEWKMSTSLTKNWCGGVTGYINIVGSAGLCVPSPSSGDDLYLESEEGVKERSGSITKLNENDPTCNGGRIKLVMNDLGSDEKTILQTRIFCKMSPSN